MHAERVALGSEGARCGKCASGLEQGASASVCLPCGIVACMDCSCWPEGSTEDAVTSTLVAGEATARAAEEARVKAEELAAAEALVTAARAKARMPDPDPDPNPNPNPNPNQGADGARHRPLPIPPYISLYLPRRGWCTASSTSSRAATSSRLATCATPYQT